MGDWEELQGSNKSCGRLGEIVCSGILHGVQVLLEPKVVIRKWGEIEQKKQRRLGDFGSLLRRKEASRGASGSESANGSSLENRLGRRFPDNLCCDSFKKTGEDSSAGGKGVDKCLNLSKC